MRKDISRERLTLLTGINGPFRLSAAPGEHVIRHFRR